MRIRSLFVALMLAAGAVSVSMAQQVHGGFPPAAHVTPAPRSVLPAQRMTPPPFSLQPAGMLPVMQSGLGPKTPLSAFAPLPPKTAANTASGARRRMSGTSTSIMYNTLSGCSTTIGYIFNVGCQIDFQLTACNVNLGGNCNGVNAITITDKFQDYYIDANASTAQSIGCQYQPSTGKYTTSGTGCTSGNSYLGTNNCTANGFSAGNCPWGPLEALTLNNQGTVVLATYDVTQGAWVAEVYITVGSANALVAYSDQQHQSPQTQFTIPTAGTNTVYLALQSAQYSDVYVIYIENTSTYSTCTGIIAPAPQGASAGLCNPMAVTGMKALSSGTLNMQWTFGAGTLWTALSTGTYSLVAYDQTQGKRVAQTQISLQKTGSAVTISLVPTGGNPSPAPAPAGTPGTRFAFDNTSDASDSLITQNYAGLNGGDTYCFSFTDPEGRVYQDYIGGTYKFACFSPGSSNYSESHSNVSAETPLDFAPNTYTVQVCDYNIAGGNGSPCTVVASQAFQLLGYNAITQFTNAAGTQVTGTALTIGNNSTANVGLQFTNDGDSYYGAGNGDPLTGVYYCTSSGSNVTITGLPATVTDSNGQTWNVTTANKDCAGNAGSGTQITMKPATAGQALAMNATITLTNLTFHMGTGCTGAGCSGQTSILPQDGQTWSVLSGTATLADNQTYITNNGGTTYAGTATFTHIGVASGCSATPACTTGYGAGANVLQQGYNPNFANGLYAANEPFTPTSAQADVYKIVVTNNSSAGNVQGIAMTLPSAYSTGGSQRTRALFSLDPNSPTTWTRDTSASCPTVATFCMKYSAGKDSCNNSGSGVHPSCNMTLYVDIQDLPPLSFNYAEVTAQAYTPTNFALTADPCCNMTMPVSSTHPTQTTLDSLAIGAFSLDAGYMTPLFNPTSEGTSTNNTVNISLQNTSYSQDTNPDYVDAIIFELPSATMGAPSGLTSGWSYLGSSAGLNPGTTDYWFGVCAAQYVTADGPKQNPPPVNPSLPAIGGAGCTAAQAQNALPPGGTFSFNATVQTGASAGTIAATAYAHGANGNGWSKGHAFSLNVTTISATSGFSKVGTYNSPSSVPANTTPQISTDTSTLFGNSYVYTITNTSGTGNNITSATITIPGKDSSGALPSDGTAWTITAAPAIVGNAYGCTLSTSANNGSATTAGANGTFTLSGCSIPANATITISFSAKAPYTVNDQYQFPAVVNGAVNASENWVGDSFVQIQLGANIIVNVDAATNVHGTALGAVCPACSFSPGIVNFGNLAANSTTAGTDIVLVDVYTNASNPIGWDLYVTQTSTNATAAPYLQTMVDTSATKSYQPVAGTSILASSYASIPVTASYASGIHLVNTGGTTATRLPFEYSNDYQIVIPAGGNTAANYSTVTYTFISN